MKKKILIPTDGGILGDYACSVAKRLNEKIDLEVIYLNVIHAPSGVVMNHEGEFIDDREFDYTHIYKQQEQQKLALTKWAHQKKVQGEVHVIIGDVNRAITSFAKKMQVDLIIMGTHGIFNLKDSIAGSHTEYITIHSKIPVISLKCDRSEMILDQIVLVSDFEECEKYNLHWIQEIAKAFSSTIVLLKIVQNLSRTNREYEFKKMDEFAKINDLDHYKNDLYEDESVARGVTRYCEEHHIDLVAIGTHQTKGLTKLFHKSISKDLVNHIYHPVLTFPIA